MNGLGPGGGKKTVREKGKSEEEKDKARKKGHTGLTETQDKAREDNTTET